MKKPIIITVLCFLFFQISCTVQHIYLNSQFSDIETEDFGFVTSDKKFHTGHISWHDDFYLFGFQEEEKIKSKFDYFYCKTYDNGSAFDILVYDNQNQLVGEIIVKEEDDHYRISLYAAVPGSISERVGTARVQAPWHVGGPYLYPPTFLYDTKNRVVAYIWRLVEGTERYVGFSERNTIRSELILSAMVVDVKILEKELQRRRK